jgi:hypothetical protein
MRKLVLTALLLTVSLCFTGCGGQMAADQHKNMQMDMTSHN